MTCLKGQHHAPLAARLTRFRAASPLGPRIAGAGVSPNHVRIRCRCAATSEHEQAPNFRELQVLTPAPAPYRRTRR